MREELQGTVLCVDDDEDARRALAWVLEAAGLQVQEAATGREGLRLAARHPGLVVLDVNLPDIDGFEVCRRIKAHPATSAIPVLHLSGVAIQPDDVRHGLAEGADGYLTKPVDPQVLLSWTKALLRNDPPRPEQESARETERSPAEVPAPHAELPPGSAAEDGDAFLGIAVALGLEACLAVLVILPLFGVAVPAWGIFFTVVPTFLLLVLCGWTNYRGRSRVRDDTDVEEERPVHPAP